MSAKSGVAGLLKGLLAIRKHNSEQAALKPTANAALAKLLAYKKSKRPSHVRALSAAKRLARTAKRRVGVGLSRLHKATLGSARSRTRFGKGVNAVKGFFGTAKRRLGVGLGATKSFLGDRASNAGILLGRARAGLGGLGSRIASGFGALKGLFTRKAKSAKKQGLTLRIPNAAQYNAALNAATKGEHKAGNNIKL